MPEIIRDTDNLLRRVKFTHPDHIKPDGSVSSFAFKLRNINSVKEKGLSADIERLTTYEKSIADHFSFRLYKVHVEYVRGIGLDCVHVPEEGNDAHALIVGNINTKASENLARHAKRIAYPD